MGQNPLPSQDILDYIGKLERRIAVLEGHSLRSVVIPEGGLRITGEGTFTVQDGAVQTFYLLRGVDGRREIGIRRDNDSFVLRTFTAGSNQAWALHDNATTIVVSDDAVSGQGLARPSLAWPTRCIRWDYLPATDAATFEEVMDTGWVLKQHPRAYAQIVHCTTVAGTTGEVRLMLDGVQVGSTLTAGFVVSYVDIGAFTVPGSHMSQHRLVLQCRRTGGTGKVGAAMTVRSEQS